MKRDKEKSLEYKKTLDAKYVFLSHHIHVWNNLCQSFSLKYASV